jgi:hypothetical protein
MQIDEQLRHFMNEGVISKKEYVLYNIWITAAYIEIESLQSRTIKRVHWVNNK